MTNKMDLYLDKIEIGRNIRKLRKEKRITLDELSKGICSIGKMSSIENGTGNIDDDILKAISQRLNVPINTLTISVDNQYDSLILIFELIEKQIGLGLLENAESEFKNITNQNQTIIDSSATMKIRYLYLKGVLRKEQKDTNSSITAFSQLLELPSNNQIDYIYKSRTYHQLGLLEMINGCDYIKAINYLERSVDELHTQKSEVPWKLYFNLTILYIFRQDFLAATISFNQIKVKNAHLDYLSSLLTLCVGNVKIGLKQIREAQKDFLEVKDNLMTIKSTIATLYFSNFIEQKDYHNSIINYIDFTKNNLLKLNFKDDIEKSHISILIYSLAKACLNLNDYDKCQECIKMLEQFEKKENYLKLHYVYLTIKALLLQKTEPSDGKKIKDLYELALSSMAISGDKSIIQIAIYKELAKLNQEEDSYSFQALQAIERYSNITDGAIIEIAYFAPEMLNIL